MSVFSQAQPFQQGIAHPFGIGRVKTESECHDHRQGIHIHIISVGQSDAPFHIARLQHSALIHGSDSGTECRGDNIKQRYQFHFTHPYIGGIGRYGNPAAPVHRDCCPFHRLCIRWRNVHLPCSQRRICRFQVSCWSPVGSAVGAMPPYGGRFPTACLRTVRTRLHVYGSPPITAF